MSATPFKELALQYMSIRGGARCLPFNPDRDRFNLTPNSDTLVHPGLNANRIDIAQTPVAIASQYPLEHHMDLHFQMLVANRTPLLVVLASDTDLQKGDLVDYFSRPVKAGPIVTQPTLVEEVALGEGLNARHYQLDIEGLDARITVPVLHVFDWPDHQTVAVENTQALVAQVNQISQQQRQFYLERGSRAAQDPQRCLPVIHCRAGVGRTGQLIAAMAMAQLEDYPLHKIIADLRRSRNDTMVQTPEQMETLLQMDPRIKG